ncbi:5033_t:CDS:2, partial [Cetraspora pellucida]
KLNKTLENIKQRNKKLLLSANSNQQEQNDAKNDAHMDLEKTNPSLQENDLTQDKQNGFLSPSMKIDNNKRNFTLSKDKDLSSDSVLAPHDELAALYLNTESQAGNKNIDETLPIMEVVNAMRDCPHRPNW